MSTDDRAGLLNMAKLAEQAERYDDMADTMKKVVQVDGNLVREERNLLSVAFKNVVGAKRSACRILNSIQDRYSQEGHEHRADLCKEYVSTVIGELHTTCGDVLDLLEKFLIPTAKQAQDAASTEVEKEKHNEAVVFYLKMKGDYHRYLAEFNQGMSQEDCKKSAGDSYKEAYEIAEGAMKSTDPIRLGLALNYSVFFYEIVDNKQNACELAKKAFDDAISELDTLSEDSYKDSTMIMQLLRDNLTLWTSEETNEEGADGDN